ncbi:putative transmembrane protein (PGPGW) [Thalassoglobus neptunius]|uniref:Putative transmembrane protein (PGPGW) n=1 Tax=Thalassoglobus neptunius TaxID=1938619 RepID=A0A5C5X3B9_9PLAN|nr:PGPGW domain-containing protein [Thalassoglobus neptunius]TWT57298.1 putative transmembrane protein (PGPGW) [Thalassoglobus neptunius]
MDTLAEGPPAPESGHFLLAWLQNWGGWVAAGSLLVFVLSLWGVSWLILNLPPDYFLRERPRWGHAHPVVHLIILILRNLIGGVLVISGVAMLVLPGQGILTILLGISLMSFPGKKRLTDWILRRKSLQKTMNWIRKSRGRPPLQFSEK